jgi:hypothetical protein
VVDCPRVGVDGVFGEGSALAASTLERRLAESLSSARFVRAETSVIPC